jgi:hypothetical protein
MIRRRKPPAPPAPPKPSGYLSVERENWARARDSACAWYCAGDYLRRFICDAAGVPDAATKFVLDTMTERERRSIVNALKVPEIRKAVPDGIYWGLIQLESVE